MGPKICVGWASFFKQQNIVLDCYRTHLGYFKTEDSVPQTKLNDKNVPDTYFFRRGIGTMKYNPFLISVGPTIIIFLQKWLLLIFLEQGSLGL